MARIAVPSWTWSTVPRKHRVVQTCGVLRAIVGFRQDEVGDWVADLGCLHRQHVRHRPPFWDRRWVLTESGRAERLGLDLDCPLCDRAEIPDGLHVVRTAGPFDAATLPTGLRVDHRVADGRWATLRVLQGAVGFTMDTDPPVDVHLVVGDEQAIPPGVAHRVIVEDGMRVVIDFLEKQDGEAG